MDLYKHTAATFTVSALIFIAFKNLQISLSCFVTGILIDLDHIFDYYMNRNFIDLLGYLRHPKNFARFISHEYLKYKPLCKVYKPLHSIELLIPASLFYLFGIWNGIATGMLIGFVLHLIMDTLPLGHIGGISLIYKVKYRFPRGFDILKQRLSRIGRNTDICQLCGANGEMILHKRWKWYMGFTNKSLNKLMVLCEECHDQMHEDKD